MTWRYGNDRLSDELQAEHARPEVVDHIHRTLLRLQEGSGRLVEKTPANSVRPWFVDAVLPDAVYLHIVRDGWACIPSMREFWERRARGLDRKQANKARRRLREASLRQVPFYVGEVVRRVGPGRSQRPSLYGPRVIGLEATVREGGILAGAALQWQRCVERSEAFGAETGPHRFLRVSLEELDGEALDRVLAHCDLAPSDHVTSAHRDRFEPAAARRRRALSEEEQQRLRPVISPLNRQLGYGDSSPGT